MGTTHRSRRLPSPALIVACLALFAALGGSTYAATSTATSKIHFSNASLKNGWTAVTGNGYARPGYALDSEGIVHLRGALDNGSSYTVAFVLPKALRPSHLIYVPVFSAEDNPASVVIKPNGDVLPYGNYVNLITVLDGASFVAGE